MVSLNGFDAREVKPAGPREPLPAGWYQVAITASEEKATSNKRGKYIELKMEVRDGEHKGRVVVDRLNITNDNPKAVEIALETLSAICHATGVLTPNDTTELHNLPLMAQVKQREFTGSDGTKGISNEVKAYKAREKGEATALGSHAPWAKG